MKTREQRQAHLAHLFAEQGGKCKVCGEVAILDYLDKPLSAVRFRTGSSYGKPGRKRGRVMAHKKCAQERSDQITKGHDINDIRKRSGRQPSIFYAAPESAGGADG